MMRKCGTRSLELSREFAIGFVIALVVLRVCIGVAASTRRTLGVEIQ